MPLPPKFGNGSVKTREFAAPDIWESAVPSWLWAIQIKKNGIKNSLDTGVGLPILAALMERTINFVAGLPRSGSTLLCNLLAQNPRFHATSTSGILDVMMQIQNSWGKFVEFQGLQNHAERRRVLHRILCDYHDDPEVQKPVVFDKSRGWLARLGLAEFALGRKVKVLVCVRDIRDVISSFERLWRKHSRHRQLSQEQAHFYQFQTLEGRCEVWMNPKQVVGSAYSGIKQAMDKGYHDRMHFIPFEQLTENPKATMQAVYQFLGEDPFEHNFDHVEQVTHEDDEEHGIPELHVIRNKVERVESQWPQYLGAVGDRYVKLNDLWEKMDPTQLKTAPAPPALEELSLSLTELPGLPVSNPPNPA